MKKTFALVGLAAALTSGCTRVGPGYVGIKVSMAGDDKGVSNVPTVTGWAFYNPALSSVFEYPTFNQTAVWTRNPAEGNATNEEITFTNADQMVIAVDVNLSYGLVPDKVPAFYVKFRSDNLDNFTHGYLRNAARDSFNEVGGKYHIENIMGDNSKFITDVKDTLKSKVSDYGVLVDQFGIIGAPRPPQAVIDAINQKVHATQLAQQKQNELIQVEADMAKERTKNDTYSSNILKLAEAQANANRKLAESITPNLVQYRALEKWNGVLPQVSGGNGVPFINITPTKQN